MVDQNPMFRFRCLKGQVVGICSISRSDAADALSISYPLVCAIESGRRLITRTTARKIVADKDVGSSFSLPDLLSWQPASCSSGEAA